MPPVSMLTRVREMPSGIRVFLAYAFLLLAIIGLSLRFVVDQAISAPISPLGLLVMCLLAYVIFTITLILQRKEAARSFALGLASLTLPAIPLLLLSGLPIHAVFVAALAALLFRGLLRPNVRGYLNQE
jgi:predicted lysophospholipase L1 biosynthesis ABC-type transport system permease subunit